MRISEPTEGGNGEGMAFDNTPMPPMGSQPQDIPMGDEPQDAPMPPDDGGMGGGAPSNNDDAELTDIINGLSIEDKAAVMKYAKSMADNEVPSNDGTPDTGMQESVNKSLDIADDEGNEREEAKIPKKYRGKKSNPFVSPY